MSRFIHITESRSPWRAAGRALLVLAPVAGIVGYALSDEGLPMAPADAQAAASMSAGPSAMLPSGLPRTANARDHSQRSTSLHSAVAAVDEEGEPPHDFAARNASVDVTRLTGKRPMAARSFLNEVVLQEGDSVGFVVAEVLPESRYERMGLQPGDVIYTLDTPTMAAVDENSMVALMQQTELELEVYRGGNRVRLHTRLSADSEDGHAERR